MLSSSNPRTRIVPSALKCQQRHSRKFFDSNHLLSLAQFFSLMEMQLLPSIILAWRNELAREQLDCNKPAVSEEQPMWL